MIGETISHYEILDKLGEGGMGEVYLAEDTKLGRKVALKVLPGEMAGSRERLERFEREARALAALDHPGIVTIHSVEKARVGGSDSSLHFLTMQLVEGSTLEQLIPEGGMPLDRLFETAVELAEAVAAAHSRRIAHRDLKPNNVMVTGDGRVKVLDFGLAKACSALEGDSSALETLAMTREGRVLGTLPYMSPEQALGKPIDHRTDVFSLGTMLYEMTTGCRPFDEESPAALVSAILTRSPAPISTHRSDAPPRLGQTIRRCLEKDPARRYQDAGELAEELTNLREAVTRHPLLSTSLGRMTALLPRARSARIALAGAAVALVAILVLAITIGLVGVEGPQISSLAVLPLKNLSGDPGQEYFVDGMTEALITDLSRIGALKVISRSSAMRYKGTDKTPGEIARELDVEALVEGSVLREGERVGITAQLIEADTESNLWADRYERNLTSILALQGEIARAIAREVEVTLTPEEEGRLASARAVVPEAHDAYLKGLFHHSRLTPQDLDAAFDYFRRALEIDPDYAPAYAGIASVWSGRQQMGYVASREAVPRQRAAVMKALELDESIADAHYRRAVLETWSEWDWKAGEQAFEQAIELNPNYADARAAYSHLLMTMKRPAEASAQIERALELDPLNALHRAFYGVDLMWVRRYDDATEEFRGALRTSPDLPFAWWGLCHALRQKGAYADSLEAAKQHYSRLGDEEVEEALDRGAAEGGYEGAMRSAAETLAARSATTYVAPVHTATLYLYAGESDRALEWLERGYEERDPSMPYLGMPDFVDHLGGDPRFQDLLRRMNLPG